MNNLSLYKYGEKWDYEKYCARDLLEFVRMVKDYDDRFIVFEEATKDISIDTWYDKYNHFFNVLLQTQAYKHNLIVIVFPSAMQLGNRNKYFIKLGINIVDKVIEPEYNNYATIYEPTIYKRDFKKLEEHDLYRLWWGKHHFIKYSLEDLKECENYIKWLKGMKKDTMNDILAGVEELFRHKQRKPKCVVCGSHIGLLRGYDNNIRCKFHNENIKDGIKIDYDKKNGYKYYSIVKEIVV
jgi:hypothetical protein